MFMLSFIHPILMSSVHSSSHRHLIPGSDLICANQSSWFWWEIWRRSTGRTGSPSYCQNLSGGGRHPSWWPGCGPGSHLKGNNMIVSGTMRYCWIMPAENICVEQKGTQVWSSAEKIFDSSIAYLIETIILPLYCAVLKEVMLYAQVG